MLKAFPHRFCISYKGKKSNYAVEKPDNTLIGLSKLPSTTKVKTDIMYLWMCYSDKYTTSLTQNSGQECAM